MEQLSSIDASFIQAESPNLPMHISTISIYDPSTAPAGRGGGVPVRFRDIMRLYEDAIYEVPLLRRRLVQVPGNMDFPYWIEDPDFDIEFHVRHVALPQPGDWRQFFIQVARLHSRPLDMERPLWEIYVIEGLNHLDDIPAGSFAVVQKLHHAAMDGASVRKMFMALHGMTEHRVHTEPLIRESRPRYLSLMLNSYRRSLGRPARLARAVARSVDSVRRINAAEKRGEIAPAVEPPHSRFNGQTSPHRVVTAATFDLQEFKGLRRSVPGATLNDVAITVAGGAVRRYLRDKGDLPEASLVAQIPVDIRSEGQQEDGNLITTINAVCGTDIADPLERLEAVRQSTESGKQRLQASGQSLTREMAEAMGPHITKAIFTLMYNQSRLGPLSNLMPGGPNFVLSNLPGPPEPVYLCGAELKWGTGLGPMMPNMGMFITVTSSLDKFIYGITACRDMMPDPGFFQECLYESYKEIRAAVDALPG